MSTLWILVTCVLCVVVPVWIPVSFAQSDAGQDVKSKTVLITEGRDRLDNARLVFTQEKKGRVAFIGGSITVATGWRDQTSEMLKKRFPETEFDFVNAGIGGTNSTFGAMRLESDVFAKGRVDLLFVEFAVNDSGTSSPGNRLDLAMEGIVRHARTLNPNIDIVIQYFMQQDMQSAVNEGKLPDSVVFHERVAEHYRIPAINMTAIVVQKLNDKSLTWEDFSRDSCHPTPAGHRLYADQIAHLFEQMWDTPLPDGAQVAPHPLPQPLEALNYEHGHFVDVSVAKLVSGWSLVKGWTTEKTCNYGGPVDVLTATEPGATLELTFEGTMVGISGIAGMDAGTLEWSVDGGAVTKLDLFDSYCTQFHRPVCHILAEGLAQGTHVLRLTMAAEANEKSQGHAARVLEFVAN